eukprot:965378_1
MSPPTLDLVFLMQHLLLLRSLQPIQVPHQMHNEKDKDDAKYTDEAGSTQRKKKKIIDVLLENTVFDIIIADHKPETPKPKEHLKELKEARNKVFDTLLSFNA